MSAMAERVAEAVKVGAPVTGGSAFGLKPNFTDHKGWKVWRRAWGLVYGRLRKDLRSKKAHMKEMQRKALNDDRFWLAATRAQRETLHMSRVARKMMTLLDEGIARRKRIEAMETQIAEQMAQFPLVLEGCDTVDFHFNRGNNEFAQLPMWVVKAKGRSFYVHHLSSDAAWSTRERPEGSTKGLIRFRKVRLTISAEGEAIVERQA